MIHYHDQHQITDFRLVREILRRSQRCYSIPVEHPPEHFCVNSQIMIDDDLMDFVNYFDRTERNSLAKLHKEWEALGKLKIFQKKDAAPAPTETRNTRRFHNLSVVTPGLPR